jgi:hypothetical protein
MMNYVFPFEFYKSFFEAKIMMLSNTQGNDI